MITEPLTGVNLAVTPASTQTIGAPVELAVATVGGANLEYKLEVHDGTVWQTISDYDWSSGYIWYPQRDGTYRIKATARERGTATPEYSAEVYPYTIETEHNLAIARVQADGTWVQFSPVQVTAVFPGEFPGLANAVYVESLESTAGIRVQCYESFSIGDTVDVCGTMRTDTGGERYILVDEPGWIVPAPGTASIRPLGMRNQWLGGTSPDPDIPPVWQGFGFYNVGMLVQTWGKVAYVGSELTSFYVDDGSSLYDGSGHYGVRVEMASVPPYVQPGSFVRITGALGLTLIGTHNARVIRPRSEQDIETIDPLAFDDSVIGPLPSGANYITLPGIPLNPGPFDVFRAGENAWYLDGNLSRRDAVSQQTVTFYSGQHMGPWGSCFTSEGYRISNSSVPDEGRCYHYPRIPVTGDQLISLPSGSAILGWHSLIGNPFGPSKTVFWADCRITDGESSYPLTSLEPWLHKIRYWDSVNRIWCDLQEADLAAQDAAMVPWTVYSVFPKVSDLALIVPDPIN